MGCSNNRRRRQFESSRTISSYPPGIPSYNGGRQIPAKAPGSLTSVIGAISPDETPFCILFVALTTLEEKLVPWGSACVVTTRFFRFVEGVPFSAVSINQDVGGLLRNTLRFCRHRIALAYCCVSFECAKFRLVFVFAGIFFYYEKVVRFK